jgi:hypothetical protein
MLKLIIVTMLLVPLAQTHACNQYYLKKAYKIANEAAVDINNNFFERGLRKLNSASDNYKRSKCYDNNISKAIQTNKKIAKKGACKKRVIKANEYYKEGLSNIRADEIEKALVSFENAHYQFFIKAELCKHNYPEFANSIKVAVEKTKENIVIKCKLDINELNIRFYKSVNLYDSGSRSEAENNFLTIKEDFYKLDNKCREGNQNFLIKLNSVLQIINDDKSS